MSPYIQDGSKSNTNNADSESVDRDMPDVNTKQRHVGPVSSSVVDELPKAEIVMDSDHEGAESSDSEESAEESHLTVPEKATKSAIRAAIFSQWILDNEDKLQKRVRRGANGIADDQISMETMLSQQGGTKKFNETDYREYQVELFEKAKTQNTIAVLPTGSGKTLIAVLLLRHMLDQEVERRASTSPPQPPKYAFFLVPNNNLVWQQHAVLECNLDHKVSRLLSSQGQSLWQPKTWIKILGETMVIVCTAEVLNQCLFHSFLSINQIHLLIFDEAHHTKQNSSYARIMRDFYFKGDKSSLPRIFGMTASPVDTKDTDIASAALDLERLMDSRIATADLGEQYANQVQEHVCLYNHGREPWETDLWRTLYDKFGHIRKADRLFRRSKELTAIVGSWGADFFWSFAFTDEAARKMQSRAEMVQKGDGDGVQELDERVAALKDAAEYMSKYKFKAAPELDGHNLTQSQDVSHRVVRLSHILDAHFKYKGDGLCIIFVETKATAHILYHIFKALNYKHLRVGMVIGSGDRQIEDEAQTLRSQVATLLAFRKGEINCLFATNVAEEGLDIPSCNLVIRFDLYQSMIGYVQSRGRARKRNSKFYHMVENGNRKQWETYNGAKTAAVQMNNWCSALPPDRVLKGYDDDLPDHWTETFIDGTTKATLNSHNALTILANFVATMKTPAHADHLTTFTPRYIMSGIPTAWRCEVILPGHSPIEGAVGSVKQRKSLAKRSAAFEACKILRAKKCLDANFNVSEEWKKIGPAMRNARIGIRTKNLTGYKNLYKPVAWSRGIGSLPTEVYFSVIDFDGPLDHAHQPLGLLTREPLPKFPIFPIFRVSGGSTSVRVHSYQTPISCGSNLLETATKFTLTILCDVFKKVYEGNVATMPYWVVPALSKVVSGCDSYQIDISTLFQVANSTSEVWEPKMPSEVLEKRFMVDKYSPRRVFTIKVDPTKKPLDAVPEGVPKQRYAATIMDYSNCMWKKSREETAQFRHVDQPVLEAYQLTFWQGVLARPQSKYTEERLRTWICPEFFRISALTTEVVTSALVFPAIIHRLEDYMIAQEAAEMIGLKIDTGLALEAMTKDSDNSQDDDGQAKINFRGGMGPNYERLEFLGDCFLKMATSVALFSEKPHEDEFEFHVARMVMLCNVNLLKQAHALKLYEYVRSAPLTRRNWYPPHIKLLKGRGINLSEGERHVQHMLGDKTVADVCESLIGAAFYQYNQPGDWKGTQWDAAVKAVTTFVSSKDHTMQTWQDYVDAYVMPEFQTAPARARDHDIAAKLEAEHPYHFKYPRLATCAFKHSSVPAYEDKVPSYQRLEFLGDSVLDLACVQYLYYNYPDADPQWLTEHKMAMVSNKFLGALCVKIGFHRHLRAWDSKLIDQITEWAVEIEHAMSNANGEVNYWTTVSTPPKCLSDIVESYIGAIFVDSGYDFSVVQKFFDQHFLPFFQDMSIYDTFASNHPTTRLQTLLAVELGCRDFRLMSQEVPQDLPGAKPRVVAGLMIHDKVVAYEVRESGGYAKIAASKSALDLLSGHTRPDFRRIYGCNCEQQEDDDEAEIPEIGTAI